MDLIQITLEKQYLDYAWWEFYNSKGSFFNAIVSYLHLNRMKLPSL